MSRPTILFCGVVLLGLVPLVVSVGSNEQVSSIHFYSHFSFLVISCMYNSNLIASFSIEQGLSKNKPTTHKFINYCYKGCNESLDDDSEEKLYFQ